MKKEEIAKKFKVFRGGQEEIMEIHTEQYDENIFLSKYYRKCQATSGEEVGEYISLNMINGSKVWMMPSSNKEGCIQEALNELIKYFEQNKLTYKEID